MLLQTKVAVTSVSNLHDARYCAGMGVDWVSFPITGAHKVSPEDFAEIIGWITGPQLLAEVDDDNADLTAYQFDGLLTNQADLLDRFAGEIPVLFKISIDEQERGAVERALNEASQKADTIILHSAYPLSEQDTDALRSYCANGKVLLSMPFSPETAQQALKLNPLGIGLRGSQEIKVGLNDFDGLADVLEAIEVED